MVGGTKGDRESLIRFPFSCGFLALAEPFEQLLLVLQGFRRRVAWSGDHATAGIGRSKGVGSLYIDGPDGTW